jgi:hypothetical protein
MGCKKHAKYFFKEMAKDMFYKGHSHRKKNVLGDILYYWDAAKSQSKKDKYIDLTYRSEQDGYAKSDKGKSG